VSTTPSRRAVAVSRGLRRLRAAVLMCCWLAGLALALQTLFWSLATFTDIRFEAAQHADDAPLIVQENDDSENEPRIVESVDPNRADEAGEHSDAARPERAASKANRVMHMLHDSASAVARIAFLIVLPLAMLGAVILGGAAAPGLEKVITALMLLIVVALVTLPVGQTFGMPWTGGALSDYEQMTTTVDEALAREQGAGGVFYLRYTLLPAACFVGLMLVALRFSSGVEIAIVAGREQEYDPQIDAEASNVQPTSLHGGRGAGALQQVIGQSNDDAATPTSATQVSPGKSPGRLI